jgi:hypothetical protein
MLALFLTLTGGVTWLSSSPAFAKPDDVTCKSFAGTVDLITLDATGTFHHCGDELDGTLTAVVIVGGGGGGTINWTKHGEPEGQSAVSFGFEVPGIPAGACAAINPLDIPITMSITVTSGRFAGMRGQGVYCLNLGTNAYVSRGRVTL